MPQVTVENEKGLNEKTFEAERGKRLVLCLEDNGIDVLHRCGGNAKCTTCRVEILSGDVLPQSDLERGALKELELIEKYRLSCQIRVESDLVVRVALRSHKEGIRPGPRPMP